MKTELRTIPGIGEKAEQDLINLGYTTVESLRGQDPEEMYARDCMLHTSQLDRCVLYQYRCAVYYAQTENPEPEKLKWWNWKDDPAERAISIVPAVQKSQIQELSDLAAVIWTEHYLKIIGQAQVDYMLEKFQSPQAIRAQMKHEGYQYFLLRVEEENTGYMGVKLEDDRLFLSKLYVLSSHRGRGLARVAMEFIESMCRENSLRGIWLTVNKTNGGSIAAYERMGFRKAYEQTADIGNGFVMDDYIMEKEMQG